MSTLIKTAGGWKEVANLSSSDVVRNPDWSRKINITLAQAITGFIAPEDGIICDTSDYTSSGWSAGSVNETIVGACITSMNMALTCPISKGDTYKVTSLSGTPTASTTRIYFVPYKQNIPNKYEIQQKSSTTVRPSNNGSATATVTWDKPFKNNNYVLSVVDISYGNNYALTHMTLETKTPTGCICKFFNNAGSGDLPYCLFSASAIGELA